MNNNSSKGIYTASIVGAVVVVIIIGVWMTLCRVSKEDHSGFVVLTDVVTDVVLEPRYYSTYNFMGRRIPGYEQPVMLLTRQAADSLQKVSCDLKEQGYILKVFDAYRPQMAVDAFMAWAADEADTLMRQVFYPELDKAVIIPQGYICTKSGHSRGSTIDLTLFDIRRGCDVDMGAYFDYFGRVSHPDVQPGEQAGDHAPITEQHYANRMILRNAMLRHGFKPLEEEWWHFTLENEPYPDTYFNFPVKSL